jgi:TPR repeat protein/S1-C subfamily serine protease
MSPNPSDPPLPEPKRISPPPAFEEQPGRRKNGLGNSFRYGRLLTWVVGAGGLMGGILWVGWQFGRSASDRDTRSAGAPAVVNASSQTTETAPEQVYSAESLFAAGKAAYEVKDYSTALIKFSEAAERGHAEAGFELSWMYFSGSGVDEDLARGVRLCRKSADQGFGKAQSTLGSMYAHGVTSPLNQSDGWWARARPNRVLSSTTQSDQWWWSQVCSEILAKNPEEALKWFRKGAEQGDKYAQYKLGEIYAAGTGTAKDSAEAFRWYQKAAGQGLVDAQLSLAICYNSGEGTVKDEAEAVRWYQKAAEQGSVVAQFNLAGMYSKGTGVPKDDEQAARWYRKAADEGFDIAQYYLGNMLADGEGVTKDQAEAALWYRKAADQGMAEAQNRLARLYLEGTGVAKNFSEAVYWFRKSADQENASAATLLGWMYSTGEGVIKDAKQAIFWYRKAADQGTAEAQARLGWMYQMGEGVDKDPAEGVRWYHKAAEQGMAEAQAQLGWMYNMGAGVDKDPAEAARWYRQAAEQGEKSAQHNIARMYYHGEGISKDTIKAAQWFRKAADQDDANSQFTLGLIYYKGEGLPKDSTVAVQWFRKAADQGLAIAQNYLGGLYFNGDGVPKNVVFAYKWFLLAKAGGVQGKGSEMAEKVLSPSQREEGQRLAAAFSPKATTSGETIGLRPSVLESEGLVTMEPEKGGRGVSGPRPFKPSTVSPDYFTGTGFFIGGGGYLITAAHVVTKANSVFACLPDGRKLLLRLIRMDTKLDLALFQIQSAESLPRGLPIVSSKSLALGQPVMTIGFPNPDVQGNAPKFTDGKISALTGAGDSPNTIQVSVPVQPGNSGGALVDMAGCVVGVISHRLNAIVMARETGALSENVNYAVKSSHLLAFLEGTPAASTGAGEVDGTPSANATPQTIQSVKDATVQIVAEK